MTFPSPGCRVLRDSDWHVLAGGPPEPRVRRSTPPSSGKALRYRLRRAVAETSREIVSDLLVVAPVAVLAAVGWFLHLAL